MKKIILCFIAFFTSVFAFSQSADKITQILESSEATYGQLYYVCASDKGLVKDDATYEDAAAAWLEYCKLSSNVNLNSPVKYSEVAHCFSKLWKINGGFFFTVTKANPRYAFKQLRADGVISKKADPDERPSGADLLNVWTLGDAKYNSVEVKQ